MSYIIWPSIVTACATGGMALAALFWGPYRGLKSTDQTRWVITTLTLFAVSFGSGVVALDLGNSNPTGSKQVYYASHIINAIAMLGLVSVTALGVFPAFDARLVLPAMALVAGVLTTVGVFPINSHFDVGFFALAAGLIVALNSFLFFFVDRMDYLPKLPTADREPIGRFNGLAWRIGTVAMMWFDFVLWNLTVDSYGTVLGVTASMGLWMAINLGVSIFMFANWVWVRGQEPIYDGVGFAAGRDRDAPASENGHASYVSKRGRV